MENFYFTFGTDKSQPFYGGWIIVKAKNMREAALIFKMYFPNLRHPEFCNCAGIYSEQDFQETGMYKQGNFKRRCHGIIGFKPLKNIGVKKWEKYPIPAEIVRIGKKTAFAI